jgi:hypothetical protein
MLSNTLIEKVKTILESIELLIKESRLYPINNQYGNLLKEDVVKIIKEKKLFENKNIDNIIKYQEDNKFINFENYKNHEKYYEILYDFFLYKMDKFTKNEIILFRSFNQMYYYKIYLKYITKFLEKYPETLYDDMIKEKLYEIIHSLGAEDKFYKEDFYFLISIYHIHYYYKVNDNLLPDYEQFKNEDFENYNLSNVFMQIKFEKVNMIQDLITILKIKNSQSEIVKILKKILIDINKESFIINENENFDDINWSKIITNQEKEFIKYIKEKNNNEYINEIIFLLDNSKDIKELKEQFDYYYLNEMEQFLSLEKEDKYLLINSFKRGVQFYKQNIDYISLKNSYNEGCKSENNLENTIKEIIESKDFYETLNNILASDKVKNYFKEPIQYFKNTNSNEVLLYSEKQSEKNKWINLQKTKSFKSNNKNINNHRDIKISNFADNIKEFENNDTNINFSGNKINEYLDDDEIERKNNCENKEKKLENKNFDIDNKGMPDIFNISQDGENEEINDDNNFEFNCQLELDFNYFIKNVFNENFLKERIIYSYLPNGIKGFVNNIPKIVINICGNSLSVYGIDKSSKDYKKLIKALFICIILHELVHLIRKENPEKIIKNEDTPIRGIYEGGRSFIYHIFGGFAIIYIDTKFAEQILNLSSWNNTNNKCNNILKEEFSRLQKKERHNEIDEYMKNNGGIKCYDSIIEEDNYNYKEEEYYYSCY